MAAIYLHVPFCKRLCGYCDFFKSVKLGYLQPTLDAMAQELIDEREFFGSGDTTIDTIYFGGGTPSLLSVEQIECLLNVVRQNYNAEVVKEITIEVNPDDITFDYLEGLRRIGVNRLSIGIQSFDDEELKFMNRRHNAQQAMESVRMAQNVGFDNITIDLIFGVAGFGEQALRRSIATALSLGVQHISAYHLTIESGTPFARKVERGAMQVVSDNESQGEYDIVERELVAAGYEHYEISNYALPGFRSRHNSSYWRGVKYLGIGAGAHSFDGEQRRYAVDSIEKYLDGGQGRYECEILSEKDHYNEFVMTSLRCSEGVDIAEMEKRFPSAMCLYMKEAAKCWLLEGKLREGGGRIFIPTEHFLISDAIIETLFFC